MKQTLITKEKAAVNNLRKKWRETWRHINMIQWRRHPYNDILERHG